jgi:hypothetical protein
MRKVTMEAKGIPQRLKPESFWSLYGTAEAVPLQSNNVFPRTVQQRRSIDEGNDE